MDGIIKNIVAKVQQPRTGENTLILSVKCLYERTSEVDIWLKCLKYARFCSKSATKSGDTKLNTYGLMALIAFYGFKLLHKKLRGIASRIISGIAAEAVMILGYFVFEGFLYGFAPSAINIPANSVQGIAGLILGCVLIKALEKSFKKLNIN